MSGTYISATLRRDVVRRAGEICGYCLIHQDDALAGCAVDHIVSEKHGGRTEFDNLALSCTLCNRRKGTDIASVVPETRRVVALFNPRADSWTEHFRLSGDVLTIHSRTDVGAVTVRLLGLNDFHRQAERALLREEGRYPPRAVRSKLQLSAQGAPVARNGKSG
ncbi:MAG TPA: HNH endonuclease signature motif containing protein [Longimicrobium sp.]|nr:HNH endonuclease signature motif containing protein [Longimicrobium sp.]